MAPQTAFNRLRRRHLQKQVYWHTYDMGDGEFMFQSFINKSGVKGLGARCLKAVCALADRLGVTLVLRCIVPKLFPYYESFGFVRDDSRPGYYSWETFKRQPGGVQHGV